MVEAVATSGEAEQTAEAGGAVSSRDKTEPGDVT